MSNNTFTLQNIDRVNFYGTDSGADVYLQGVSTGTSGVCVSGSLLVNGDYINFGSSLGQGGYGFRYDTNTSAMQYKNPLDVDWNTFSGGGGGGNPAGNPNDVQFYDPITSGFAGNSSFQFYDETNSSGVCALTVDGNVFSSMGVSDNTNAPVGTYTMTATEFVNGFIFPPCHSADENQLFVVRVPTYTDIALSFSDVLKEGQTFDTVIYGTSIGSSPGIGISFPSDITVLENMGTIFDRRLGSGDNQISNGLSFHFAGLDLKYYQGVVIRSRMGASGVSMYPYATSFYTC